MAEKNKNMDKLDKLDLDISEIEKKVEDIEQDISGNGKKKPEKKSKQSKTFYSKNRDVFQNKVHPEGVEFSTLELETGMKMAGPVYRNDQLIIDSDTQIDGRKLEFLQKNLESVYVIPKAVDPEEEKRKKSEEFNKKVNDALKDAVNTGQNESLKELLNSSSQSIETFQIVIDNLQTKERNENVDKVFNTLLMYYDMTIREMTLKGIKNYNLEFFYEQLFKSFIEFEYEDFESSDFAIKNLSKMFKEKNKSFFFTLNSYYEVLDEDKKEYILSLVKGLGKEKMKKLLFYYANNDETRDTAYDILNLLKNSMGIETGKKVIKNNNKKDFEKKDNTLSFAAIVKEIQERKERKKKILEKFGKKNFSVQKNQKTNVKKNVIKLEVGDATNEAVFDNDGNIILPSDTVLTEDNISFLQKNMPGREIEVYSLNEYYNSFLSITESLEKTADKLELYIFFSNKSFGRSELETLGIVLNFPDEELKIESLKYIITNLSPKRFYYIIEALKLDIEESPLIIKDYFEAKNDIFSMKLFVKILAEKGDLKLIKKAKKIFNASDKLKNMLKAIISNSSPAGKKVCIELIS
ncbi:MAG: hypothetical protein ACQESP_09105 [Candidatus Muiribacteriota bacterium]